MDRVTAAAATAGLGERRRSDRVNADAEGGRLVLGCWALAGALLWLVLPLWLLNEGERSALDVLPFVLLLSIGAWLVATALWKGRGGRWLVHCFEHGVVMERTRGRVVAARYDDVRAELFSFRTSGDSDTGPVGRLLLRLDLPGAGGVAMDEPEYASTAVLRALARHFGVDDARPIDEQAAAELLSGSAWR